MIVNVREAIREYKRQHRLKGPVNRNKVVLLYDDVEWSSLHQEDYDDYSLDENEGCEFSTEIGTEVEITSGRLIGLPKSLPLSLEGLPPFIEDLIEDPIEIDLNQRETPNIDDFTYTEGEIDLFNLHSANFECQVELEGDVIFSTSHNVGVRLSSLQVPISHIIGGTSWTVEGTCTFHLGLNENIEWL